MSTPTGTKPTRGAGVGGGLLFLAVAVFVAWLVVKVVVGFLQWVLGIALVVLLVAIAFNVLRRRR